MVLTRGRTYFVVPGCQRTHPSQELIAANTELLLRRGDYITPRTYTTRIYQLGPTESAELSFTPAKRTAKAQRIPFACIVETPGFDSSSPHWCAPPRLHGRSSGLTPCAGSVGLRHIVVTMQLRAFHGILGWEPGGGAADAAPPPSTF